MVWCRCMTSPPSGGRKVCGRRAVVVYTFVLLTSILFMLLVPIHFDFGRFSIQFRLPIPSFPVPLTPRGGVGMGSAQLSHRLRVSDRRRNTPKWAQKRSECRVCWAWFGFAVGPNPVRNLTFPAGSLKVSGALLAQPSGGGRDRRTWVQNPSNSKTSGLRNS